MGGGGGQGHYLRPPRRFRWIRTAAKGSLLPEDPVVVHVRTSLPRFARQTLVNKDIGSVCIPVASIFALRTVGLGLCIIYTYNNMLT